MRMLPAPPPHPLAPGEKLPPPRVWPTLKALFPYLWLHKGRVLLALGSLVAAKMATVAVPMIFKDIIDHMTARSPLEQAMIFPALLLMLYGLLRFASSLFTELREIFFARVTQEAVRRVSLEVFNHLHSLSLRFHLERQTGGVSRDMERGTRAIANLITYTLYSILPTLVEMALVTTVLLLRYDPVFVLITAASLVGYIIFTVALTNRRLAIRRAVNETDSLANSRAVDSLINYETVKYFNNEHFEARRYDEQLLRWQEASTRSQVTLSYLNMGQQAIIVLGVTAMMWQAARGVEAGQMTVGDLVLVNAFLIQLYIPLNFLGVVYRELRQSLTDIERMFNLLEEHREIQDRPDAKVLVPQAATVTFRAVDFSYTPERPILRQLGFTLPAGHTVAVVGPSGAGKSTLSRLLFRFYDVNGGQIFINDTDIRHLTQSSLRRAIGIVPQDTVLFNDTIGYNIAYGRPDASQEDIEKAAEAAQLLPFIRSLPEGFASRVGERGLKLSGGEKQRVAIARALLKDPPIMIFDEATSALDSHTEQAILDSMEAAARGRTTLVIAHRLSTVIHADQILVLQNGEIAETGRHDELLAQEGIYARMWALQNNHTSPDEAEPPSA